MIGVHAQPLADDSLLSCIGAATPGDCAGLIDPTFNTTNTVEPLRPRPLWCKPTRVDRGIEYAMTHCGNLLRRLAD